MENQQPIIPNSQPTYQPKRKWYKKWWVILIFAFIFYFIIIGILLLSSTEFSQVSQKQQSDLNQSTNQVDGALLYKNITDDPQLGDPQAKVRIVEFADFQCTYCLEAFGIVREILAKYDKQIYFVFRDFPIVESHPLAKVAAEAAQCANEQGKFWQMHDKIFMNQEILSLENINKFAKEIGLDYEKFEVCLTSSKYSSEVIQDFIDGQELGVKGTPTFFINGYRISGVIPSDIFDDIIAEGLKE